MEINLKRDWWKPIPGVGIFIYPFVTKNKGLKFWKAYSPYWILAVPGILWKAPLIAGGIIGLSDCSRKNINENNLEQIVDSCDVSKVSDQNKYFKADKYFKYD